ncbi:MULTISPECIES: glutamate carboxypeptidase [Cobetia]|uniref:M20/M25/M40 family metallo-hydrolase n=1 Tax=Cobetia crustatorum TaxID=553385 RepID=A0A558HM56_9GAMM|nr:MULTISPECIES: glutamate carboxypeptidase [Cobetia]TVU70158.1 M20/M25/M40 family metallo-hydrolase [Cobetia crustatorum]
MRFSILAMGLSCAMGSVSAQAASHQDVQKAVEQQQQPLLQTLETLVNVDSGTGYSTGLSDVEALLTKHLKALGAEVETYPAKTYGGNTLVGRLQGDGDRNIMLMIHYDTVFNEGAAKQRPFHIEDGRAYGPGVGDAKGGVAVILHSLEALKSLDFDDYGQVTVVFNPDEEKGSPGSHDLIHKLSADQDAVLVFEPTFADEGVDAVTVVTKGINYAFLEVKGRASHAGGAPEKGRNAIMELSHQLLQLDELGDPDKKTTLNWTVVEGGTKRNIIPEHATAEGDMRYFDSGEYERVLNEAQKITEHQRVEGTEVEFRLEKGRPPLPANPESQMLAEQAQKIYQELGLNLQAVEIGGGTDAAYAYHADADGPAVLESLGLVGGRYHSDEEFVLTDSVVPRLYLTTRMIMELSHEASRD